MLEGGCAVASARRQGAGGRCGAKKRDARLIVDYIRSFLNFFGNSAGAVRDLFGRSSCWLYAAPLAPHLRQAAIPAGIDP